MQAGHLSGRRRLLQAGSTVVLVAKATFPGPPSPALDTASLLAQSPCSVPDLCTNLTSVKIAHTSGSVVRDSSLTLTLVRFSSNSLRVSTAYVEDGKNINAPVLLSTSTGGELSCTTDFSSGSRHWYCTVETIPGAPFNVIATAPNTADPTKPLTSIITLRADGE